MTKEDRALARKRLAEQAAEAYNSGHTLMEVAEKLGVSYGKVHALVKEAGAVIRPRGARFVPPGAADAGAPAEDAADAGVPDDGGPAAGRDGADGGG